MGRKSSGYLKKNVDDFREFQVPKLVQACFLVLGILVGVGVAAAIKSSFYDTRDEVADEFVEDEEVPVEAPAPVPEKARKVVSPTKQQASPAKPQPQKQAVRTPPLPEPKAKRKIVERRKAPSLPTPVPRIAPAPVPVVPAPAPAAVVHAPTPAPAAPKKVVEVVEAPKAQPERKVIIHQSKVTVPVTKAPPESFAGRKSEEEPAFFTNPAPAPAKKEVETRSEVFEKNPESVVKRNQVQNNKSSESVVKRGQPHNLKNRLEDAADKVSDTETSEESVGSSFQDRLRKSTR